MIRDTPDDPDPEFARVYAGLPAAGDLEPWLGWTRSSGGRVLYVGAGGGRLAVPLAEAGADLVLMDAHPGMTRILRARLPGAVVHQARIETAELGRYPLVMGPSGVLEPIPRLRGAARHLAPGGRLAAELTNPHWLAAGAGPGVRVRSMDRDLAEVEVDYPGGRLQVAQIPLVWPAAVEDWLAAAGLELLLMRGRPDSDLETSESYFVLATPPG